MEVTVRDMDVTVEHTGMCLLRVTGMTVLNQGCHYDKAQTKVRQYTTHLMATVSYLLVYASCLVDQARRQDFFCYNAPSIFWR